MFNNIIVAPFHITKLGLIICSLGFLILHDNKIQKFTFTPKHSNDLFEVTVSTGSVQWGETSPGKKREKEKKN